MKKLFGLRAYQALLSTIVFLIVVMSIVTAQTNTDDTIVVMATVLPERSIVVDEDLNIQQIYSNTKQDVRPNVYQDSIDGPLVAYGDSVRKQYEDLKNSTDFSKPGIVYERPGSPIGSLFRSLGNFFRTILGL